MILKRYNYCMELLDLRECVLRSELTVVETGVPIYDVHVTGRYGVVGVLVLGVTDSTR